MRQHEIFSFWASLLTCSAALYSLVWLHGIPQEWVYRIERE
jgi:hypothetical protein